MDKQIETTYALFGLTILSVVLHNLISAIFASEEVILFLLTFGFLAGFVFSLLYNILSYSKKGKPKDLWKLGWLGLIGLLGLLPNFSIGFYGFFGFFGFFGIKK